MNDFKLGSPHDGWDMMIGKAQYGILLDGIVEDGLPECMIAAEVFVVKRRSVNIKGELVTQYMIEEQLGEDLESEWFVDSDSIDLCEAW